MNELNFTLLLMQMVNIGLLVAWIALTAFALRHLHQSHLTAHAVYGWLLVIVFVPLIGALLFLFRRNIFTLD